MPIFNASEIKKHRLVQLEEGEDVLRIKTNSDQGIDLSNDGRQAVRRVVADLSPKFADEVISINVSGCATALPCTLKRVRCTKVKLDAANGNAPLPAQMTIYDDNNLSTGRVIWQGTLNQDADAEDIPVDGLPAMTGLYCKWAGAAGEYNYHITVGVAQ